ncbi:putative Heat shock protein 70 family [Helianthus annuus]|uniref:Heat shock protein 70 family n=1 Tax=Helianthus annuus TaxID=4232 RepID=A0A9K3IQV5_HELAN|nr:putative Heat shock protein 70 family [Helianthus annuus]
MNTHSSNYRPQMHKMLFKLGLISFLLLLNSIPSQSAVSSIDLGSEWIKVAVVNLKPGQSPISIAINEMSKRKSPALVAFHANDRLIGEEAAGLVARYPNKVYSQVRDLIGKPFDYVKKFLDSYYLPFDVVEDSRGGVGIKIDDGVTVYSPEELTAMVLGYGMRLAEFHSKVMYGIDKDFSNGSRYVVFYDMGSSSTYAALVYFSAYNTKEYGKTVSVNQFQVKDVRWDPELGGQNMEMRLVEYFADEFNKQVGNGIDVRQFPKAMAKLKKQVKRTKEILSANTAAPISVESLLDDRDFRSTITRQKFEEMCEDLWERSIIPVKELLKHSGLKADEIYAFELIGGGTRVPKLQAKLQEFLGKSDVDRHLDADEATVLGASLHAANLSDGIKLNRKLGMIDGSMYGFMMDLDGPELVKDETTTQLLVPRLKKLPIKMYRSITHNKDFDVSLLYENENLLPPGVTSRTFAKYAVSGLADASEKYMSRNLSSPVKATLHFSLSRSGILSLDRADAVIEISEWVEVPKKNQTLNNTNASTPLNQTVEANSTNSAETSDVPNQDDLTTNLVNSTENNQNSVDLGTEKKLKKRTFRIPLKISEKSVGSVAPLSEDSLYDGKLRLDALDSKDADRRRTAELKNDLEGYIYATKEKLDYLDDLQKVSSSEQRQSFIEKLDEVQDWLYTDGEDASATQFQERLDQLKAIGDPIFFRYKELTARPEASETAKQYFSELQEIVSGWESKKPWISKEKIDQVLREADDLKKWLDDKEAEQQKLSASSTPAYTSQEVMDKLLDLKDKVSSTNRIPKPKPKVEKPTVKNNDSKQEETVEKPTESQTDESKSYSSSKDDNNDSKQQETVGESTEHDEL